MTTPSIPFIFDFRVIQCADDTMPVIPAINTQLLHIKNLVLHFAAYTSLKVDYSKSIMVAINTPDHIIRELSTLLGCQIGTMPLPCLDLPLSLTKP